MFQNLNSRGEKGGNANIKTKHTEPLTKEISSALNSLAEVFVDGCRNVEAELMNLATICLLKHQECHFLKFW